MRSMISIHPLLRAGTVGLPVSTVVFDFYPPALTSGNLIVEAFNTLVVFLSTRSYEREHCPHEIIVHPVFLSTRSYERELTASGRDNIRVISIHPLLRAGTLRTSPRRVSENFYPPALTSGNSRATGSILHLTFLSTRSYERERSDKSTY